MSIQLINKSNPMFKQSALIITIIAGITMISCAGIESITADGKFYPVDRKVIIDSSKAALNELNLVIHSAEEEEGSDAFIIRAYQRQDRHYHSREQNANLITLIIKPDPEMGGMKLAVREPQQHVMSSFSGRILYKNQIYREVDKILEPFVLQYERANAAIQE